MSTETKPVPKSKHKPKYRKFKADELTVDPVVQRPLSEYQVNKLASNMNLDALGAIIVSIRANGDKVILDGQSRVAALKKIGFGEWEMNCITYSDLPKSEEAGIFRRQNQQKLVSPFDDFDKGVVEGDPDCVGVVKIAKECGLRVMRHHTSGGISCVRAMQQVYKTGETGPSVLRLALSTAVNAWGAFPASVDGTVIKGLGAFFGKYHKQADVNVVTKKLAKYPGGPSGLIGIARGLTAIRRGSVYRHIANIIVQLYNKGKNTGKLSST